MQRDSPEHKLARSQLEAKAHDRALDYHGLFIENPIGRVILADLEAKFFEGTLLDPDPLKMAHRVGMRDLVAFIRDMAHTGKTIRDEVNSNG